MRRHVPTLRRAELLAYFLVTIASQLQLGDPAQPVIAQLVETTDVLLGHDRGELGEALRATSSSSLTAAGPRNEESFARARSTSVV